LALVNNFDRLRQVPVRKIFIVSEDSHGFGWSLSAKSEVEMNALNQEKI